VYGAEPPKPREPIILDLPDDSHNPQVRAVISGDYKIIVYGTWRYELFNLKKDPGEEHDLAKEEPEKFAEMKALFEKTWSTIPAVKPFGGIKLKGGSTANGPMGPPEK
jgi:hypothetical protein